ncbi:Na+/H+-dicarboxylate symporter [Bradyrhizobium sp. GM0.4]
MTTTTMVGAPVAPPAAKPWYKVLYIQVLIAIVLGAIVGWLWPSVATNEWIKALGDGFIKLIKMVIAPIIFCTVVSGIAHIQDAKKVGRIGVKALVYFEIVSTFALVIGLVIGNLVKPGAGFGGAAANAQAVANYAKQAEGQKSVDFVLHIIPDTVVGAFAQGEILQVLLFSVLFGFAIMGLGERGHTIRSFIDDAAHAVFGVISIVMRAAPIGAFGAMAYTIGKFGTGAILNLVGLIATFYLTAGAVRIRRARNHRALRRLLHLQVPRLHQGRAADCARHLVLGKRVAVLDGKARAPRLLQVGGRPRGAHGLFVQS